MVRKRVVRVRAHKRRTKKGKVTRVRSHIRTLVKDRLIFKGETKNGTKFIFLTLTNGGL